MFSARAGTEFCDAVAQSKVDAEGCAGDFRVGNVEYRAGAGGSRIVNPSNRSLFKAEAGPPGGSAGGCESTPFEEASLAQHVTPRGSLAIPRRDCIDAVWHVSSLPSGMPRRSPLDRR
jgi:hypothetical protein